MDVKTFPVREMHVGNQFEKQRNNGESFRVKVAEEQHGAGKRRNRNSPHSLPLVYVHEFQIRHTLEMSSIPRQQWKIVGQSDSSDQAVAHAYRLTGAVEFATDVCGTFSGRAIEWQHGQGTQYSPDSLASVPFSSPTEEFEARDCGRLEQLSIGVACNLLCDRLDTCKIIDQHVAVGKNQRQLSLSCLVVWRNSAASFSEIDPASDKNVCRRLSRSVSPWR
jgi:hypothetical protein